MPVRDAAANQLANYAATNKTPSVLTTATGAPIGDKTNIQTAGPRGPALLQDVVFLNEMQHFVRERIPERIVHAKGGGAHGVFECTADITKFTKAVPFASIGKKTPLFVRFSTVGGESGSADTARDPRGFSIKMYTEEGNWDLVGNNTPIFFIRDPFQFPQLIHSQKRNPVTHCKDADAVWDFFSLRPESTHQVMFLYSDRGTPDGYRHMNGYGSHTFMMVNEENESVWCKFHLKPVGGSKNLTAEKAHQLTADNPDYAIRDLYNAIETGDHPIWKFFIQTMTLEQADKWEFNPFDVTKVWPHSNFPQVECGKMTLNKNPVDYFSEVEQAAFSPGTLIPGIQASPDKMLQGRLLSYQDAHFYRLGANFQHLSINRPQCPVGNMQRGGFGCPATGGAPNYYPNSFGGPKESPRGLEHSVGVAGGAPKRYESIDEDNFTQPKQFWTQILNDETRANLVNNIAGHLCQAQPAIQARALDNFGKVHHDFADMLRAAMQEIK